MESKKKSKSKSCVIEEKELAKQEARELRALASLLGLLFLHRFTNT